MFRASAGAILLWAGLYFLLDGPELAALLLAAAVHELGHLATLALLGAEIRGVSLEASGLCIRCGELTGAFAQLCAALSGPAAGIGLFFILRGLGYSGPAEVSLMLSCVNLLPALPLDGGRALLAVLPGVFGARALDVLGFGTALALMGTGLVLLRFGFGLPVVIFGGWILLLQPGIACKTSRDVVNYRYLK